MMVRQSLRASIRPEYNVKDTRTRAMYTLWMKLLCFPSKVVSYESPDGELIERGASALPAGRSLAMDGETSPKPKGALKNSNSLYDLLTKVLRSSKSQSLYTEWLGFFPIPRGYIEDQGLYGESSEFFQVREAIKKTRAYMGKSLGSFQVPGPLYRGKDIHDDSHLAWLSASLF